MAWVNRGFQACVYLPSTLKGKQGSLGQGTRTHEWPGDCVSSKSQTWLTGALRGLQGLLGQSDEARRPQGALSSHWGRLGGANLPLPKLQGGGGLPGIGWPVIQVRRDRRGPVYGPGCLISYLTYSFTSWAFWRARLSESPTLHPCVIYTQDSWLVG